MSFLIGNLCFPCKRENGIKFHKFTLLQVLPVWRRGGEHEHKHDITLDPHMYQLMTRNVNGTMNSRFYSRFGSENPAS